MVLRPLQFETGLPLTVQMEWEIRYFMPDGGDGFRGFETISGIPAEVRKIRNGLWEATNLAPNTTYIWYLVPYFSDCGSGWEPGMICLRYFTTGPGPSPTPSVTPQTPTPSPETPTPQTPTPSPTPLPGAGWVLTSVIGTPK